MQYGTYRFSCGITGEAVLPPYKGSTFRGAFGGAMKSVVCALRRRECPGCLLSSSCLYARIFETNQAAASRHSRLAVPPHPYVIEPPLTDKTHFRRGDAFEFTLLLFGEANAQLPYFVYAFQAMGERGLGKRLAGHRGGYEVLAVHAADRPIYSKEDPVLVPTTPEELFPVPVGEAKTGELTIRLLTPLRLKFANTLQAELPFGLLVRALLRRISGLFACYGAGEPPLDYRGLVHRAGAVSQVDSTMGWFDWQRYSSRQEQAMLMGGIIGEARYRGDFAEFIPLLELGKKLHLGKQTTFGLGLFDFSLDEERS